MKQRCSTSRRSLGVLLATGALVAASAAASLADEHTGVECFVDDEWAGFVQPGDEVTCEAWGLTAEETFEWEVEFVDLESDEVLDDDWADDELADSEGFGEFSFTVPAEISSFAFFEGYVTQDDTYEEPFFGLILVLSDVVCDPDPVVAGNDVDCEVHGLESGEWFYWAVELSDGLEFDDLDGLEFEMEDLADLEELEGFFELMDEELAEPHAEGEGEAGDDGIGRFSFEVPEDTDAIEYLTVAFAENSFGFYAGEIEPADDVEAPVSDDDQAQDDEEQDDEGEPIVVERPTRVDTGAGGAAAGGATAAAATLGVLLMVGIIGALFLRRRVHEG